MTNIVSIEEIRNKQLNELSLSINNDISEAISNVALKTTDIADKLNLTAIDFAGLIGGAIGHYFANQILPEKITTNDFDKYAKYCKELNEPLLKGFDTYVKYFVDEVLSFKSNSNLES